VQAQLSLIRDESVAAQVLFEESKDYADKDELVQEHGIILASNPPNLYVIPGICHTRGQHIDAMCRFRGARPSHRWTMKPVESTPHLPPA